MYIFLQGGNLFLDVLDCFTDEVERLEAIVKNSHGFTTRLSVGVHKRCGPIRSLPDTHNRDFAPRPRQALGMRH
jgi:hypothetical protein